MKNVFILCLLIFTALSSFAQKIGHNAEVSAIGKKFFNTMLHEDATTMRSLLTEDFLLVSFDGQLLGSHMLLDGLSKGILTIESGDATEADVRVNGETGIVIGQWKVKGVVDRNAHDLQLVYTLVCVRPFEDWKIASLHLTNLPK